MIVKGSKTQFKVVVIPSFTFRRCIQDVIENLHVAVVNRATATFKTLMRF